MGWDEKAVAFSTRTRTQPSGPNFRRSCTTAWKKVRPKSSFFHSYGLVAMFSKSACVIAAHVPMRLARMPLGGSKVSLHDVCSTGVGKYFAGIDVSHSRKSSWMVVSIGKPSTIFSSLGIQLLARWQFCSTTQSPFLDDFSMIAAAIGPCPCPSEMACMRSRYDFSVAKRTIVDIGSAPVESTKTIGVALFVSGKTVCRSSGGCSMYSRPISPAMNSPTTSMIFSGRKHLTTSSFWKEETSSPSGAGSLVVSSHGASQSISGRHALTSALTEAPKSLSSSTRSEMVQMRTHCAMSMPSGHAGSFDSSTMPAPTRKSCHSAAEILPALRMMAVVSMKEKVILCSPKSAREQLA
jgi:hypothetical protein